MVRSLGAGAAARGAVGVVLAIAGAVTFLVAPAAAADPEPDVTKDLHSVRTTEPSAGASPSASPSPSVTRSPSPTGTPSQSPSTGRPALPKPDTGHAEPDHVPPLSAADLEAQIAAAEELAALLEGSSSEVAVAMRRMDELSDRSNAVLESLADAQDTERSARSEAATARSDLNRLESRLATARALVREWVFDVYSGGGSDADVAGMLDALLADDGSAGNPLGDLVYLTDQRTRALREVRMLTARQSRLTETAEQAEASAEKARRQIEKDRDELDTLMNAQREKVGALRTLQMAEVEKAGPVASALVGARSPEAKAAAERLRAALSSAAAEVADIGEPCSDDSGDHGNGLFPESALCPVWGAPGERLAPGAAAAFSALSKAYAAQTGEPLCVTDSYRPLVEQFAVKESHGRLAATPGTSRHGLGRAVDLCGGVESFGSPAHLWMRQNAPLYGWFHPAWAGAGGALPEPWHFEYAG
ncbi:D-alanyl-D-alanine carboxypeptidase family protein [Phycicoccus sp. CSK15P-2]|uniref:M15 family metallopeptidase n=1 Tax=Phycicoccus sp. CSK15P-2 TaxID=2807627 RepID=UPI001950DAF6|nr:M15 family metallopeptidase [Phycicoccus sp. CSK15P-2]MBM6405779.1 D-alanyl-D-alanine carboxypeptidase family protein [Phycicoccus sp. CSK15P-2]